VIGIIGILISILLPALNRARDQANAVKCAANLRSIGQAVGIYLNINRQFAAPGRNYSLWETPGTSQQIDPNHDGAYWGVFYAVAGNLPKEIFSCPSIIQKDDTPGDQDTDGYANKWCGYGLNSWGNGASGMSDAERDIFFGSRDEIALHRKPSKGWNQTRPVRKLSRAKFQSQTVFCQDAWETQLDGGNNGDTYASTTASNRGKISLYAGHDIEYLRHSANKVSNCLFLDGHVEPLTKEQQKDERLYTGNWNARRSY